MYLLSFVLIVLAIIFAVLAEVLGQPRLGSVAIVCLAIAVALQTYPQLSK